MTSSEFLLRHFCWM